VRGYPLRSKRPKPRVLGTSSSLVSTLDGSLEMKITQNPEIVNEILGRLVEEYVEEREFPHATQLIYCLTKSYFDITHNTKPTNEELLLFAIGWGLERVLLETKSEPGQKDGIHYSPDFVTLKGGKAELKTTRLSSKKTEGPVYQLPDGWLKQMMAYCYANGGNEYHLVVYHIVGQWRPPDPKLVGLTLEFTDEELEENWQTLLARRDFLSNALETSTPPAPYEYHLGDWECKNCRYKIICEAFTVMEERSG